MDNKDTGMRNLKIKLFVAFVTISVLSCRQGPVVLTHLKAGYQPVDSTLLQEDSLEAFIAPYRDHVNSVLDAPLAFAPATLAKTDGDLNSSIGNLMADIVLAAADSLSRLQDKKPVDMVLLNFGGIRAVISEGTVTERHAYEVMPFENTIYLATLSGGQVLEMLRYLAEARRAHPIAGMRIRLGRGGALESVLIGGQPFDETRSYRVATSNYLVSGGDNMTFFEGATETEDTGYRIRNAMVDYFRAVDTLRAQPDDRFTQIAAE